MSESECKQCDGGYYCDVPGLSNVTAQCAEGYYCQSGVDTAAPSNNNTGFGGKEMEFQISGLYYIRFEYSFNFKGLLPYYLAFIN